MEDTIAAIATPQGEGGIGIVRISGDRASDILSSIFVPKFSGDAADGTFEMQNRKLTYGHIINPVTGDIIDQVLAVFMKGPHTYTKEDVVEINCHGGILPLRSTLSLILECGARLAEQGEFTKRAFLNGRIDLSQAEAVIDVIRSKTRRSFNIAISQMEGRLSGHIADIREELMDILVNIAVNIDYPDEDVEDITGQEIENRLISIGGRIEKLLEGAEEGRILREGLEIAIAGKPNVGKSSIMNALLEEDRAIVTEIPGTTRDTIEEGLNLRGIPVRLTDTAGIRKTDDKIEKMGIERSKEAFNRADLILFVLDVNSPMGDEDREIARHLSERNVILLLNKSDLEKNLGEGEIKELLPHATVIHTSMKEDFGLSELKDEIEELVCGGRVKRNEDEIVSNIRHVGLLKKALEAIKDGVKAASIMEPLDLIELDVRRAWEFLGEIIGETVAEDIIDQIFQRFCLGK
ncbi:MAG: tRNA uridine-5-carboxymethylaminomethyl(34) synthesis GTPase MnmE [Anaerovoracaceae bacterium]|jgi:tRNA modification GTPase